MPLLCAEQPVSCAGWWGGGVSSRRGPLHHVLSRAVVVMNMRSMACAGNSYRWVHYLLGMGRGVWSATARRIHKVHLHCCVRASLAIFKDVFSIVQGRDICPVGIRSAWLCNPCSKILNCVCDGRGWGKRSTKEHKYSDAFAASRLDLLFRKASE